MSEAWGKTTCLQLALEAEGMKFVSHGGVQVTFCVASGADVELLGRSPHSYRWYRCSRIRAPQGPRDSA